MKKKKKKTWIVNCLKRMVKLVVVSILENAGSGETIIKLQHKIRPENCAAPEPPPAGRTHTVD